MIDDTLDRPAAPVSNPGPLLIGSPAPRFSTRTTMGDRSLDDYRGRWLVFFSHPADFTPVCTSEFIAFSKLYPEFRALDCDLLALSVDSLFSHIAWVRSIKERFGVAVPFPITEDPSMAIAAAYGMIHPDAHDASTVRATFVIDPDGIIRAMVWYPMSIGRSVAEIFRLVQALQTSDKEAASTPEGWHPGDDLIEPAPLTIEGAEEPSPSADAPDWYYRVRKS
ncbi:MULTISPECIES: peroxiredoxin [unclassified Rhizobium]|jgi:peroxiredoxin (alkyl hydroperoxide reductase subunit C)|uniref:peroxiredoxin n=1 Tax=unclassified Rhizobium TaxID=2613769 RepID=UPI000645CC8B|nr:MULTISPECIES: peroxiredoxin [unclassified Rhizobium]OJY74113.1 MAG: peroxiredoxin [Rhizobium sp. 60-20]RKD61457.1 peroxiredoxin (alkyl hydroperoxide reductase subunit C) [Rhizobium sp. WW_1]